MKHILLLAATIGALPSAGAQEPEQETVDTSFAVPVKRPILCTRTIRHDGSMTVRSGKSEQLVPVAIEDEVQFIDEYSILTKDREEGTRYFVKAASKAHGEVADPPLAGSVFLLYKLVASPKSYAAAEREFIKARASLSEMK